MIFTVRPGPTLCLWGDRGQCIVSVPLSQDAALTIAAELLNAVTVSRRNWHVSPDPVPNGSRSPFEHERDVSRYDTAPCDCDDQH